MGQNIYSRSDRYKLSARDVSRVTDFSKAFMDSKDFDDDISRWKTSSAKDMSEMCTLSTPAAPLVLSAPRAPSPSSSSTSTTVYVATSFNGDVSQWDVGKVQDMKEMCKLSTPAAPLVLSAPRVALTSSSSSTSVTVYEATSFNQQLGGAWATSTADKFSMLFSMFSSCPGSIEGKTNNEWGTPIEEGQSESGGF